MKNIIGWVLSGFLMLCVLVSFAACGDNSSLSQKNDDSSHNEQTQNGDDTAQEGSGQNDNEAELSDNEQTSPEDILQKDWGTVEFSLDGRIHREEEQTFSAGAGTFAQININPNIDCYSELQKLLADDEVLVSVSSDNEDVLSVLGENQVLFRAPGNANLSVEYSLKGVTQTRIVNCTVTEDEHDVGCDPMTVGEPGRCLLLEDGKAIASSIGNTESNRDEYLFIFDPAADDPFASQNKSYVELENEAYGL